MVPIGMKQFLALLIWFAFAAPAGAQIVTPQQLHNLVSSLQSKQKPVHASATASTPPAAAPAAPTPINPAAIGEGLLEATADQLDRASDQVSRSFGSLNQLPATVNWLKRLAGNPRSRRRTLRLVGRLLGLLAAAGFFAWLSQRAATKFLHRLALRTPEGPSQNEPPNVLAEAERGATEALPSHGRLWYLLRRLPFALLRLLAELVPIAVFVVVGYLLLGTGLFHSHSLRVVCLATISVLVPARAVWCVMRMLASPGEPGLRLINVSEADARSLVNWTSSITVVMVAGIAISSMAGLLGLPLAAQNAFGKLLSLVVHLMLVAAVLRARVPVAQWLRAPQGSAGPFAALRDWLAAIWAHVAIFFIVALWFVWAIRLQQGPERLLQVGGASLAVLIVSRLLSILGQGAIERAVMVSPEFAYRVPGIDRRIQRYGVTAQALFRIVLTAASFLVLFQLWGWNVGSWFAANRWGSRLVSGGVTMLISLAFAVAVWEWANFWLYRRIERLTAIGATNQLVRLRTLQPMMRTALLAVLVVVTGMTLLSEVGVNIGPLLAGAGIAGLAIGFGSQKLVQDVITGLFLLLDNAVEVGDGITAAGLSGTVEHLSLCYLRLRGADGTLHYIPFSSVTTVSNSNRGGRAAAVLRFEFEAGTDVNTANALLARIGKQMRDDERFDQILSGDLAVQGIEEMTGDKIAISAQFPCVTSGSGAVIYEFRRLLALEIGEAGLKLAGTPAAINLIASQPLLPSAGRPAASQQEEPTGHAPA